MCKCILLVCLLGAAAAASAGAAKKELVMLEIEPTNAKDSSNEGSIEKRQTYRQEAQASYGAAPGQYIVRTGQQAQPQQLAQEQQLQQQQQEVPEEYLAALQQLAIQQQQQEEVARQQLQQPHIQQLVVSRDPQAHAARFTSTPQQLQAHIVSQDSRYAQPQQPQPQQPQRPPATRRPPTEQQILQQTFFESNQLQGQLQGQLRAIQSQPRQLPASQAHNLHQQRLQASLSSVDPSYAAAAQQQQQRYAEQQQIAALQAQAQTQFYNQAPQAFPQPSPQPSQQPPRQRIQPQLQQQKASYPGPPPEQYLRETSPPVQQQPLIVSLNREQIQVQASPDQSVYYTSSSQQQPSPSPRPVEYQTASSAELAAYLRQQHLQQASPSASPAPQYYRPQQLQQPSPSAQAYAQQPSPSAQAYAQQQSSSADPSAYLRQQIPTVDPLVYQQVQQAVTPSTPAYRPVGYASPSPTPQYVSPSPAASYRRPQPQYAPQQQRPAQTYYTRQRQLEEQSEEPNQEAISSILSQYPGRSPYESSERTAKGLPNPSPSRSSIFVTTASSKNPEAQEVEDDDSSNALPVVRLPTPQGQRALTQREYQALLAAGFDISPVESRGQQQSPTEAVYYQTSPKYQRSYVTASPPVNQLAQPRRKPQQAAPQEETQYTYEQVVVAEPQEQKLVARRPGGPRRQQLRHPSRPRDEYTGQGIADSPQEQQTYLTYDNAPAATSYATKRREGVTRLSFLRREREE